MQKSNSKRHKTKDQEHPRNPDILVFNVRHFLEFFLWVTGRIYVNPVSIPEKHHHRKNQAQQPQHKRSQIYQGQSMKVGVFVTLRAPDVINTSNKIEGL